MIILRAMKPGEDGLPKTGRSMEHRTAYLRLTLPQPLEPIEKQLALVVAHQLIVESLDRFPESGLPEPLDFR
jgi:hypothetical protein